MTIALALASAMTTGCLLADGKPIGVPQPAPATLSAVPLRAGAAQVDITPPPGLPTYGYSTNGASTASGVWLRLEARIIGLQQGTQRVVLVQADLGAASSIVHRQLAAELAPQGISPANLMFATTHTHGGPGGFLGEKFYNRAVGSKPGYVPEYVKFLVDTIAQGAREALADGSMAPARLGVASAQVEASAVHNRSIEAWRKNYTDRGIVPRDEDATDRTLTLLRVDTERPGCGRADCYAPLASWSVFAVHGTSMVAGYPLYHGDVHGLAARVLRRWVGMSYPDATRFVAATATGAEGDASPGTGRDVRGRALTMRVATAEASAAFRAMRSLDAPGAMRGDWTIRHAYQETPIRGASSRLGRTCVVPRLGAAQAAGSEESRGPLPGFLDMAEGALDDPGGCHATKIEIGGGLQDAFFDPSEFPDVLPFQVISFGERAQQDSLVLAAFPGEPTVEVGREVVREVRRSWKAGHVAVVGLTNAYATYFTLPSEYLAQHYEGGTTLYGPHQGILAAERLGALARAIGDPRRDVRAVNEYLPARTFQTGAARPFWPHDACRAAAWRGGEVKTTRKVNGEELRQPLFTVHWSGSAEGEACPQPRVSVECPASGTAPGAVPRPLVDPASGLAATDEGYDFEVWRDGSDWQARWSARWDPGVPSGAPRPTLTCHVVVRRADVAAPLVSDPFVVTAPLSVTATAAAAPPGAGAP